MNPWVQNMSKTSKYYKLKYKFLKNVHFFDSYGIIILHYAVQNESYIRYSEQTMAEQSSNRGSKHTGGRYILLNGNNMKVAG